MSCGGGTGEEKMGIESRFWTPVDDVSPKLHEYTGHHLSNVSAMPSVVDNFDGCQAHSPARRDLRLVQGTW